MRDMKRSSAIRKAMAKGQARTVLASALVASLFASVGLFHAATHVAVVRAGYELGQVQARHQDLLRENARLKMERATLRSAPRLESIARARLGLTPPAAGQVVVIAPDSRPSKTAPDKTLASAQRDLSRSL